MDVTKKNFKDRYEEIKEAIDEASFVAIDGEFTGLNHSKISPIDVHDTPEERHYKTIQSVCDFLIVQFGLCTFSYDKETKQYTAKPYNFYVFPKPHTRAAPDLRFACQSSSLDFLASQGFDFNKWIREGIPYLNSTVEVSMKEATQKKHEMFMSPKYTASGGSRPGNVKGPVLIPDEHKEFMDGICDKVAKFVESGEEDELPLPSCTAFQRKLTYQTLEYKFAGDVHLQSKTDENKRRYILVTKFKGEEEMKKFEEARMASEMSDIDDAVGFTKVIKHLSQSGKLVIGHNMHLDVIHTIHQFLYPLPHEYQEFKSLCQSVFPKILDTKLMANTQPFKDRIESSVLGHLVEITQKSPFKKPEVELADGFDNRYKENELLHEAGFDSYVTGKCFISLANFLGQCHNPPLDHVTPSSPLLEPFLNKIFMMRSPDIPYMNLGGPDLSPSRDLVFHLSFPPNWKYENIATLFFGIGSFHVDWIDNTSAFIVLMSQNDADTVQKSLCKKGTVYELVTFDVYKHQLKRDVLGDAADREPDCFVVPVGPNLNVTPHNGPGGKYKRPHSPTRSLEKVKKTKTLNVDAPEFESRITPTSTPEKEEVLNSSDNKITENTERRNNYHHGRPHRGGNHGNMNRKNRKKARNNRRKKSGGSDKQPEFCFAEADFPPLGFEGGDEKMFAEPEDW